MNALPLLATTNLNTPLAWRQGQAIAAGQFIAEAQALAANLPEGGLPINLCQDRYLFALALAAALLRGQLSLLPPNALPETLRNVPGTAGAAYALVDDSQLDLHGLPALFVQRPLGVPAAHEVPLISTEQAAVCLLTSGSTGAPQPHAKHWGPLVANIRAEAERLAQMLGQPPLAGLTLVATVPAQHSYGLESSVLLAMLGGAAFEGGRPFYPADIAAALAAVPAPRGLVTTPFHLKTLLLAGVELPATALVLSATAPLSPQLAAQAEAAVQGQLIEIYGCTEAGQVASRRTTAGDTWTTLGELRIASQAGEEGEQFIVSGGHVTEPTPLADVLVLHSAQQFRLLGRANDLIHVGGKRSSLAHLNFHLNRIEGVEDGAFWLPDEVAEGIVRTVAFVVAPTLSARQITAALREHLESAFVPRRVVHVDALPRVATGKLTVATLRQFALETLAKLDATAASHSHAPHAPPAEHVAPAAPTAPALAPGVSLIDIPADHPAFAGHFPGKPVLPGVVLLSLVSQAVAQDAALAARLGAAPSIDNAKFLTPVGPGAQLKLVLREQGRGVAFEVFKGETPVARGQLSPAVS
jgi:acyl-CoA synthetase (AMP-forming)/AMP-acid ligase II